LEQNTKISQPLSSNWGRRRWTVDF
jgi:hypothetical protein